MQRADFWKIDNGVLSIKTIRGNTIPSADEIYSVFIENKSSDIITSEIKELLASVFKFSRFPIDLKIILSSAAGKNFIVNLGV